MANAMQVAAGFWKLKLGAVNSYLLETEDGLLIVDSGYPGKTDQFFAAVSVWATQQSLSQQNYTRTTCYQIYNFLRLFN